LYEDKSITSLKKSSIRVIIGLMSFALLGVIAMQLYFLMQSYDMQSKIFDRSVNEALDNVVTKLSRQDADKFLNKKARHQPTPPSQSQTNDNIYSIANTGVTEEPSIVEEDSLKAKKNKTAREKHIALLRDSLQRMIINQKLDEALTAPMNLLVSYERYVDEFGQEQVRATRQLTRLPSNSKQKIYKYDTVRYIYKDPQYGDQVIFARQINPAWKDEQIRTRMRKDKDRKMREVKQLLTADSIANIPAGKASVMQNLFAEYQRSGESLASRLDRIWIDSLLRFELHNKGIDQPFIYDVTTANNDSLIFSNISNSVEKPVFVVANSYQTPIFNKEVINDPGMIRLSFPQKSSLILSSMKVTMSTTAGLLFVLIVCFGYTLFSILRQKKISEMKTDFINNMTHEFKTPVSTIMIASEALKDTEITADKSRIARLANIIYEENERLGSHIERVLNVARIDRNDFKLESKPVDINEMITLVLDSMALKLQKCDAIVELNLDAENGIIKADELHFSNVLYNLIDNAIKYSEGIPKITISSLNKNGHVIIKVADEGIGMSRDQQTKIFEQFYRIPTGNVHNVKGFGLGLSYVNTIVKRLNGSINVRSEKDKGSEFELKFSVA
jgi:two-component system phosphate regulon sensor histidine kinase PhoR